MSQQDIKSLRAEYAAMSRKDWNAVLSVTHRDFKLTIPGGGVDVETIVGVESARRTFEDFFRPFEALTIEPEATGLEIFPRREKALEAAGLSDQDAHADFP